MGLFSSSKLPQPPLPNLAIHLYFPTDRVFKPDDDVSGHIALIPIEPITPQAIEVSLFGLSSIWHRTSHSNSNDSTDYRHWRDNAPLFEVAQNVLPNAEGKEKGLAVFEPGKTYTFPFKFRFPTGTGNTRSGQYEKDSDERWTVKPHRLPPTFLHTHKHGDGTEPDYAKVEYGVRVKLICPGIGVVKGKTLVNLAAMAPVLFQPPNPNLQQTMEGLFSVLRYPKAFSLQSSALTGQAVGQIGFRQSMRDRFSSNTPRLDFEALLEIPDYLTAGSEFRFRASFRVLQKTDSVTHIPAIKFTVLKLDLLDYTFIRAPRDWEASSMMSGYHLSNRYENMPLPEAPFSGQEHRDFSEQKTHLNSIPESATLELENVPAYENKGKLEQAKDCAVWFTARVPSLTTPTFCSFAITRVYGLKAKVGVEIGGKLFTIEALSNIKYLGSALA